MWDPDWIDSASCRTGDPDALFVTGAAQHEAKRVCRACPVRTECLAEAMDGKLEFGVWGGLTERERRALALRRPDVTSWRKLLAAPPSAKPQVSAATPELVSLLPTV